MQLAAVKKYAAPLYRRLVSGATAQVTLAPGVLVLGVAGRYWETECPDHSAASAAASLLRALRGANVMRARLVVADFWTRPLAFSLHSGSFTWEDIDALVGHQFRKRYGAASVGWHWRWCRQGRFNVVAVAWPEPLAGLAGALSVEGIRLLSATPEALYTLRSVRGIDGPAWLVLINKKSTSFIRTDSRQLIDWQVLQTDLLSPEELVTSMARAAAQRDDPCREVWLVSGVNPFEPRALTTALMSAGWTVRQVLSVHRHADRRMEASR